MASSSAGFWFFGFAKGPTRPTTCVWTRSIAIANAQNIFFLQHLFFFSSDSSVRLALYFSHSQINSNREAMPILPSHRPFRNRNGNRGFKFEEVKFENKSAFGSVGFFFFILVCFGATDNGYGGSNSK